MVAKQPSQRQHTLSSPELQLPSLAASHLLATLNVTLASLMNNQLQNKQHLERDLLRWK
jgi:hypothetical protein